MLTKAQSKGMLGGTSFEVRAQVRLTPEEQKLIKHYRLEEEVLFQKQLVNLWGQPTDHTLDIRVKHFLSGEAFKCKDLAEVIACSDSLKSACETLKAYHEGCDYQVRQSAITRCLRRHSHGLTGTRGALPGNHTLPRGSQHVRRAGSYRSLRHRRGSEP